MNAFRISWSDVVEQEHVAISTAITEAESLYLRDAGHLDDDSLDAVLPELRWQLGWNNNRRRRFWLYADGKRTEVCVDEVMPS